MLAAFAFTWNLALAEPPSAFFLPGAQDAARGDAGLSGGVMGLLAAEDPWALPAGFVRGDLALSDRVQLNGFAMTGVMASPEWGPVGLRGSSGLASVTVPAVGVRVQAVRQPRVNVAPWLYVAGLATLSGSGGPRGGALTLAGLAVDAGGERLRVDLSLPVVGGAFPVPGVAQGDGMVFWPWLAPVFSEAGLSWRVHPGHTLRLSMTSFAPGLGWRWSHGGLWGELRLSSAGFLTLGSAQVGWRW